MLTQKQIRFVEEYLVGGVGSRAAIAAGYSEKTARSIASELLRKPAVAAELERRRKDVRQATNALYLKVVEHAAAMAFANWGDFYDADGRPLRGDELTRETRMAIQAVRRPRKGSASKTPFVGSPYRAFPKLPSLKFIAQLAGLVPPSAGRPRGPGRTPKRKPDGGITAFIKR
ncbi:MAG TPA: terminase small subunit [Pseudolabrys sp.]|uniref:terminase small subunit n=1 Tax=Pseudolabrys sp. TaxID=1960880 RepID=UPI002DDCA3ED|nr:terminase small subunit [Pseudolabrys sp.]HEV2629192.1 terminase small subunit [Pseudolabrys sp.]